VTSAQYNAAFVRALILAICTGLLTALTTWQTSDDGKTIIIAAGTAAITAFLARWGVEGTYDTNRAKNGDVKPGDVGSTPSTTPVAG
jgi:hypothetical protein